MVYCKNDIIKSPKNIYITQIPTVCDLQPSMENGHAVDKSGSGLDLVYKYECDDGYWLKKGSGNTAYCNNKGEPVYPVCEKRRFYFIFGSL